MKNIITYLIIILVAASCCEEFKPNMKFELVMDDQLLTANPTKGTFTAGAQIEIWISKIQNEYPIPLGYNYSETQSENHGEFILLKYNQAYFNKFNVALTEADKGKYFYFQVRLKNEYGFSNFRTFKYQYGSNIVEEIIL
jgi:hypothetical protein